MSINWGSPTTADEAARRAGGRSRYNATRWARRFRRRAEMVKVIVRSGASIFAWGLASRMAERFGIHRTTASRDLNAIWRPEKPGTELWARTGRPARRSMARR